MASELESLPLFPLNTVLFPHAQLQLHVFEDRYRRMVGRCLEEDRGFGIVLIRNGTEVGGGAEPYLVGTEVSIVGVQHFPDGSMDVRVRGDSRFRVRRFDEDAEPYLIGFVEAVDEDDLAEAPRTDALTLKLREYLSAYIEGYLSQADVEVRDVRMPEDPTALSFLVANMLNVENRDKQRLLELTDTLDRIGEMIPMLERNLLEAHPRTVRVTPGHFEDTIHPN